jgi:fructose-specific phosphotransferase system IIC component
MRKIPKKYSGVVMGVLFGLIGGLIMSFLITWLNLGFVDNFFQKWMVSYIGQLPLGIVMASVLTPPIKKFVDSISE